MSKYTRSIGASLLVAASVLAACSSADKKGPDSAALAADSALNKDLALANRDTNAQPALKDVPATPAAEAPARTQPATRTPARTTPRPPAPRPTTPAPAPKPVTTASGNTVTTNPGAAANPGATGGGAVGMIAAGSELRTNANTKICTNTNAVGDHVTATVENSVSGTNGAVIPAGATVNMT